MTRNIFTMTLLIMTLSACSTLENARKLAGSTAADVDKLSRQLQKFESNSDALAKARARVSARLEKNSRGTTQPITAKKIAGRRTGHPAAQLIDDIDVVRQFHRDTYLTNVDVDARIREILASLTSVDTPKSELASISATLREAKKPPSFKDQIKALIQFAVATAEAAETRMDEAEAIADSLTQGENAATD